ncbi:hypothetical protein F5Y16DRAFT_248177 [Xylariaceae sp. FL0255]|nr:hypothetical protein F5Y16DRAFT_248177 [Xylariaceae sp. FL0255]
MLEVVFPLSQVLPMCIRSCMRPSDRFHRSSPCVGMIRRFSVALSFMSDLSPARPLCAVALHIGRWKRPQYRDKKDDTWPYRMAKSPVADTKAQSGHDPDQRVEEVLPLYQNTANSEDVGRTATCIDTTHISEVATHRFTAIIPHLLIPPPSNNVRASGRGQHASLKSSTPISEEEESDYEQSSHGRSPRDSTDATSLFTRTPRSSVGNVDVVPDPTGLFPSLPEDQNETYHPVFDEDESSLIEGSKYHEPQCDNQSLRVARASIQGSGIDPREIHHHGLSNSTSASRPFTGSVHSFRLSRYTGTTIINDRTQFRTTSEEYQRMMASLEENLVLSEKHYGLQDRLWEAITKAQRGIFLANGTLQQLLTFDSVQQELRRSDDQNMNESNARVIARMICENNGMSSPSHDNSKNPIQKIFAILVYFDRASDILLFVKTGICDFDLPLITTKDKMQYIHPERRASKTRVLMNTPCFRSAWGPHLFEQFWKWQWIVLAPSFEEGEYNRVPHRILDTDEILPFVESDDPSEAEEIQGGYGRVYMARIHPDHHIFSDPSLVERGFAIKEIKDCHKYSFLKEVDILKKFRGTRQHPHVVTLLATFEQGKKRSLIFYRAECDLMRFWTKIYPTPQFDRDTVLWFAQQTAGLASGLSRLHKHKTWDLGKRKDRHNRGLPVAKKMGNTMAKSERCGQAQQDQVTKYGRHGDIKAENILCFHDPQNRFGTLKFADFGASELKSRLSVSEYRDSVANTWNYRPPEMEINCRAIRQPADIWSLGCVYLEFIAWLLGGHKLLHEFAFSRANDVSQVRDTQDERPKSDAFFDTVLYQDRENSRVKRIEVKASVIKFFDTAHQHPNCTEYIHDFLNTLQDDMLVIEPSNSSYSNRITCEQLSHKLDRFYKRCFEDETYATRRSPWCRLPPRNLNNDDKRCIEIPMAELAGSPEHQVLHNPQQIMSALHQPMKPMLTRGQEILRKSKIPPRTR